MRGKKVKRKEKKHRFTQQMYSEKRQAASCNGGDRVVNVPVQSNQIKREEKRHAEKGLNLGGGLRRFVGEETLFPASRQQSREIFDV